MTSRLFTVSILASSLVLGFIGVANAQSTNSTTISPVAVKRAPELDPTSLGSGIFILAGGLLVLHERRRRKKD
jgi:hypothetical protein